MALTSAAASPLRLGDPLELCSMAFMLMQFEVEDFDSWKQTFDSDPAGRREVAKGHQIFRAVEDPNQVFVATEYGSVEDAKAVR